MLIYLEEFTIRLEDIIKVIPSKNEKGGTYIHLLQPDGTRCAEYTTHDYRAVIEAISTVESRNI